jgi:hypothetical protein
MADTRHTEQIITEELIARAAELRALRSWMAVVLRRVGRPVGELPQQHADWAARLFDGRSIVSNGSELWYRDGKLHRDDGPAVVFTDGCQEWYRHGKLHREGGPAVDYKSGHKEYYRDGKLHRDDGPAIVRADGTQEWWRDGKRQPPPK